MQIAACHVQWGGLAETVTVETLDRVNEAEGETDRKSVEKKYRECDLFAKSRDDG